MVIDKEDVIKAINNDNGAFEKNYVSIYKDLYKMAYYMMGNGDIAADVVSDTVMDAFAGINRLKEPDRFECWILKILTTKCKRKMREKYEKFSVLNPNARNLEDYSAAVSLSDYDKDEVVDVNVALSKLNKTDRAIVILCVIEGYKSFEAAQVLSLNPSTVRSRLNRSLKKMRKYLCNQFSL